MAPMLRLTHNRSALRTVLLFLCFADSFSDKQEQQPQWRLTRRRGSRTARGRGVNTGDSRPYRGEPVWQSTGSC